MQRRGMARELSLGPLPRWQLLCVSASISRAWAYKQCATVLCFPLTKDGSDCLHNILLIRILHHHLSFIDICSKKYIWPQVRPSSISFTCMFASTVDKGAQWSLLKFIRSNYLHRTLCSTGYIQGHIGRRASTSTGAIFTCSKVPSRLHKIYWSSSSRRCPQPNAVDSVCQDYLQWDILMLDTVWLPTNGYLLIKAQKESIRSMSAPRGEVPSISLISIAYSLSNTY